MPIRNCPIGSILIYPEPLSGALVVVRSSYNIPYLLERIGITLITVVYNYFETRPRPPEGVGSSACARLVVFQSEER